MPKLVKDGQLVQDPWQLVDAEATLESLPEGKIIVPLALWVENRDTLWQRLPDIAVWFNGDEEVDPLKEDTEALPLIAVNFPTFTDGRGFSAGRLLRERYNFRGELRAIGYFLRDQMFYLHRCGFSAFTLDDRYEAEEALSALQDFTEYYQGAVVEPLPLFRRRQQG